MRTESNRVSHRMLPAEDRELPENSGFLLQPRSSGANRALWRLTTPAADPSVRRSEASGSVRKPRRRPASEQASVSEFSESRVMFVSPPAPPK